MDFKVGDRVIYIVPCDYYGIQGTIQGVTSEGNFKVLYDCENSRKHWGGSYSDIEFETSIRLLTPLEKAMK